MPLLALLVVTSQAQAGVKEAGGGDICEDRIKTIRSDINSWIQKGGAAALSLPQGTSLEGYSQKMLESISDAKIRCVGRGDKGHPVQVYGTPKVCVFNRGPFTGATITCDRENFMKMGESDQYVLVHHEYAGLAGIEKPNKDDSEYGVSNQISAYLTQQTVLKLAVKSAPAPVPKKGKGAPCDQQVSYEREIVKPATEKILIPEVEKTLKKVYAANGEKIKSIKSTYQWVEESSRRAAVLVHTRVLNNMNLEDVFVTAFARSNSVERTVEYTPKDALGRKYPQACWAGIMFDNNLNSDATYGPVETTFYIFNATTKSNVGKVQLHYENLIYGISFYR